MSLDDSHIRMYWQSKDYRNAARCWSGLQWMQLGMLWNIIAVHPLGKKNILGDGPIVRLLEHLRTWAWGWSKPYKPPPKEEK